MVLDYYLWNDNIYLSRNANICYQQIQVMLLTDHAGADCLIKDKNDLLTNEKLTHLSLIYAETTPSPTYNLKTSSKTQ